jgi:hypothetical protein
VLARADALARPHLFSAFVIFHIGFHIYAQASVDL